jgi:hypothetical protein
VMVIVSLCDPTRLDPSAEMLALHAPEGLGLRVAEDELAVPHEVAAVPGA